MLPPEGELQQRRVPPSTGPGNLWAACPAAGEGGRGRGSRTWSAGVAVIWPPLRSSQVVIIRPPPPERETGARRWLAR